MKDLAAKAVVTGADGFYYREEHEWRGMGGEGAKLLENFLKEAEGLTKTLHGKNEDAANLTATLSATVDGVVQPDIVVKGVSYRAMNKFQKHAAQFGLKLVEFGEEHGRKKWGQSHKKP